MKISLSLLLGAFAITIATGSISAQSDSAHTQSRGVLIIASPFIGDTVYTTEQELKYRIFTDADGFRWAKFYLLPDSSVYADVHYYRNYKNIDTILRMGNLAELRKKISIAPYDIHEHPIALKNTENTRYRPWRNSLFVAFAYGFPLEWRFDLGYHFGNYISFSLTYKTTYGNFVLIPYIPVQALALDVNIPTHSIVTPFLGVSSNLPFVWLGLKVNNEYESNNGYEANNGYFVMTAGSLISVFTFAEIKGECGYYSSIARGTLRANTVYYNAGIELNLK